MWFVVAIAVVTAGAAGLADAATRWVATNGSDSSGDGSAPNPWATIPRALDGANDGDLVLVRPGTYNGRVDLRGTFATGVVVRSELPYRARLRHTSTVVTCYYGQGIALEGFDIAHAIAAAPLVIQVQDLRGGPGGTDRTSRIAFRNNIIHDSRDNDLLKINNAATNVVVSGNLFYNQTGSDEHIDVNSVSGVVVEDNVFFNDFEGSGRINGNDTSSYIVVKDSNADSDGVIGSSDITIRRNVFLHWQGSSGSNFVLVGEDGMPFHEARAVLIENNLMIGDSPHTMRAPFGVKGGRDITFRSNTITGNLPAEAYAARFNVEGQNPPNTNIVLTGNVWLDPTGTMQDFSDTPPGETTSFTLARNLYWNGGAAIPTNGSDLVNYTNDAQRVLGDARLTTPAGLVLPRWNEAAGQFADGSTTIRQVFESLVDRYARPASGSAAIDAGSATTASTQDILGRARPVGSAPDLGAYETGAAADAGAAGDAESALRTQPAQPNPFAATTTVQFALARTSRVRVEVFDAAGRRVRMLLNAESAAGDHAVTWDGRDEASRVAAAGLYVIRVRAAGHERFVKTVLLRMP